MNQPTAANPAQVYEQYFVPAMFVPWATILLRHAALEPGERVLDVACGTGVVARHAAPQVADTGKVVGLDMKPAMLGVARSLPPPQGARIEWQAGPKRGPSVLQTRSASFHSRPRVPPPPSRPSRSSKAPHGPRSSSRCEPMLTRSSPGIAARTL
jgi:hypothetical protein